MNKFTDLLKLVETFYKKASRALVQIQFDKIIKKSQNGGYYMPDDEDQGTDPALGKYPEITGLAQQISDDNLRSELLLIAEMYKKSLQLNGGYNSISRAISILIENYLDDEDNPEQQQVEDVLNDVVKDLRTRAGGGAKLNQPDSSQIISQLKQVKDEYNRSALQEDLSGEKTMHEALTESGLGDFEEAGGVSTFDPTGGVHTEKGDASKNRGYSTKKMYAPKNWADSYENEKQRYIDELNYETIPNVVAVKKKLISILSELKNKSLEEEELIKITKTIQDPEKEEQLSNLQKEISILRKERGNIKLRLRNHTLSKVKSSLENELNLAKTDRERFLIQQKIELNKNLISQDDKRGEETKLRKLLIEAMSEGRTLSPDTLSNLLKKIEEASKKKVPLKEFRKERAAKTRAIKQSGTLSGLIIHLQQKLATTKNEVAKAVKNKAGKDSFFTPYKQAVQNAKDQVDREPSPTNQNNLDMAIRKEAEAIKNYLDNHPAVTKVKEDMLMLYAFRDNIKALNDSKIVEADQVEEDVKPHLLKIIAEGEELTSLYDKLYKSPVATIQEILNLIKSKLQDNT